MGSVLVGHLKNIAQYLAMSGTFLRAEPGSARTHLTSSLRPIRNSEAIQRADPGHDNRVELEQHQRRNSEIRVEHAEESG